MNNKRRVLILGCSGQDGSFLAESCLRDGNTVYGMIRRCSTNNTRNIDHIKNQMELIEGDLCDSVSVNEIVRKVKPHEIYNLAAQSHVHSSFEQPEYTTNVNALGVVRILEAIRNSNFNSRFYQAGTSEQFGNHGYVNINHKPAKCDETTPMHSVSPYAISKLYAYHIVKMYREAYNMFACTGILFNHESERRGDNFVTMKICNGFKKMFHLPLLETEKIPLGNIDAQRDWGYAGDYVEAMKLMLRNNKPVDYVVGTGEARSVRDFVQTCIDILKLPGTVNDYVRIDPKFYRPIDVNTLCADSTKIKEELGWEPKISFENMVRRMLGVEKISYEEASRKFVNKWYRQREDIDKEILGSLKKEDFFINYKIPKNVKEIFSNKFQEYPDGYIDLYISDIDVSDNVYGINPESIERVENGYKIRIEKRNV